MAGRILGSLLSKNKATLFSHQCYRDPHSLLIPSQHRSIFTTSRLDLSWMDSIKGVFTGKKPAGSDSSQPPNEEYFTLQRFADEMGKAKKLGTLKKYIVGRSSEATFADAFEKQETLLRYLSKFDPHGKNIQNSQKQEAAKHCKCTIADVENTLAKYVWAKEAQMKLLKLKEEGKPIPTSMAEIQKLMGSTPVDLAQSNMAKSGTISRNAFCPCGSKKRYKRCCGQDKK